MSKGRADRSRFVGLLLAYVVALQGLLGVWAGATAAGLPDLGSSLCRSLNAGGAPEDGRDQARQCVVMCLAGACANSEPVVEAAATVEYGGRPQAFAIADASAARIASLAHGNGLKARGPPTIG